MALEAQEELNFFALLEKEIKGLRAHTG